MAFRCFGRSERRAECLPFVLVIADKILWKDHVSWIGKSVPAALCVLYRCIVNMLAMHMLGICEKLSCKC